MNCFIDQLYAVRLGYHPFHYLLYDLGVTLLVLLSGQIEGKNEFQGRTILTKFSPHFVFLLTMVINNNIRAQS